MKFRRTLAAIVLGIASLGVSCNHEARGQDKPLAVQQESDRQKKTAPLIEILDEHYRHEIIAEGLKRPEYLTINPSDGHVFFIQGTGLGREEEVCELVDGKAKHRFKGAGDPWGQRQITRMAINSKDEILVFSRDYLDTNLSLYNLKDGKLKMRAVDSKIYSDNANLEMANLFDNFGCIATNPIDSKFYLASGAWVTPNEKREAIYVLDSDSKLFFEWCRTIPFTGWINRRIFSNLCCDAQGNFYTTNFPWDAPDYDSTKTHVVKISSDKKIQVTKLSKPDKVLAYDVSDEYIAFNNFREKLVITGWGAGKGDSKHQFYCLDYYILEADLVKKELSAIAKIRGGQYSKEPFEISGVGVDKNDIYITIQPDRGWWLGSQDIPGKIIKISRK